MGVNKAGTSWEVGGAESAGTSGAADSASMMAAPGDGGCAYESSATDSAAGCAESGFAELWDSCVSMSDDADAGGAEAKGEAKEEGPTAVSCAAAAGMKTEGLDAGAGPSVGAGSANGLAAMEEEVSSDGEPAEVFLVIHAGVMAAAPEV